MYTITLIIYKLPFTFYFQFFQLIHDIKKVFFVILLKSRLTAAMVEAAKKILPAPFATLARKKKYRCYYSHRLRDLVSPICKIFFFLIKVNACRTKRVIYYKNQHNTPSYNITNIIFSCIVYQIRLLSCVRFNFEIQIIQ